ncbi:hypothetical protein Q2U85_02080 [Bacillus cereus]|uniref:hypothetical protein n=1 Tax=Bacillus cereus TaxID=1396 RepID=UPI00267318A4|nr:hypothetical protein [Bacillus cereus]WKT65300.1 hypothetical protein Q2U85_02080 [Bacillus cereus]
MSKDLDLKQRVLVSLYLEYQKELPEMGSVSAELLETDRVRFRVAIAKLQNEGLINGSRVDIGHYVHTDGVMLTPKGLQYVEEVIGIKPTMSASEKVKEVGKKAASWGYNEIKDFSAKVLGEVISKTVNN